ncbi:MAG: MFS transporter [bacterium]
MSKTKALILFTVFIDILGIGIVIPVLPFFVKSFGASDFTITALFATYALCAFISAPILGALSDRIGRRPILIVSIISSSIGWFIFAGAQNIIFLFTGRIIDGLAAGNITTAQSYLSDISKDEKDRTSNLGLIGAMFGIGLIVGPLVGGLLGAINHTLPFYIVGALALANAILAYFFLPETHHERTKEKMSINPLSPIFRAFAHPVILPIMIAWFFFNTAIAIQQSIFALYLNKIFGIKELGSGLLFTGIGVLILINQLFLLKKFWLARFQRKNLLNGMLIALGVGFIFTSTPWGIVLGIGVIFTTFGQSLGRTIMTGLVSGLDAVKRGENLGTMNAFASLAMILGPFIGGSLFIINIHYSFIAAGIFALIALWAVNVGKIFHTKSNYKQT